MTHPPFGPDPNRPQDTPRSFPTYGRPPQSPVPVYPQNHPPAYGQPPSPYSHPPQQDRPPQQDQPQQHGAPPYGQQPQQGQPQHGQPLQGGVPLYGQPPQQYGAPPYGQAPSYGPPPYGYGYGYPGMGQRRTNNLAVAALVTGLAGLFVAVTGPVAVGLGIAALVQLKKRPETGTAQAVIGLVLGSLQTVFWTAFLVIMIAVGGDGTDDYSDEPGPSVSRSADRNYIDELAVGECFDDVREPDEVVRVPCAQPHDGELISNITLPAGPYPGDTKVRKAALAGCDEEFRKYVGNTVDKSELDSDFWYPDEEYWEDDDRLVVCAAYGPDGDKLTGSVKGTKR